MGAFARARARADELNTLICRPSTRAGERRTKGRASVVFCAPGASTRNVDPRAGQTGFGVARLGSRRGRDNPGRYVDGMNLRRLEARNPLLAENVRSRPSPPVPRQTAVRRRQSLRTSDRSAASELLADLCKITFENRPKSIFFICFRFCCISHAKSLFDKHKRIDRRYSRDRIVASSGKKWVEVGPFLSSQTEQFRNGGASR